MGVSSTNRTHPCKGSRRTQQRGKAHHPKCDGRTHFLNATFASIPGCEISNGETTLCFQNEEKDIVTLQQDVRKFFGRFGIDCEIPTPSGNAKKDLRTLYTLLQGHLPNENWNVEIVYKDGKDSPLKFLVYEQVKFPEYIVWGIPIKRLAEADEKTRKLLALTFAVLRRSDMYEFPENNLNFQYSLAQMENNFERDANGNTMFDEGLSEFWSDEYKKVVVRYLDGNISQLFNEIRQAENLETEYHKPLRQILEDTISHYKKDGYPDTHLLELIEQEVKVSYEDRLTDYHIGELKGIYGYDFGEDKDGCELIDFANLFYFCYDAEDCVTGAMIECLNSEYYGQEIGCLYRYSFIDSEDICDRMSSDYPERWAEINEKLIEELSK